MPRSVLVYTAVLALLGLAGGATAARVATSPPLVSWADVIVLLAALTVAGCLQLEFRYRDEVDALDLFEAVLAPIIFVLPALSVVALVIVAKVVAQAVLRIRVDKALFNVAQWMAAAGAGSATLAVLAGGGPRSPADLIALAVAMLVVGAVNDAAVVLVLRLAHGAPLRLVLTGLAPIMVFGWVLATGVNVTFGVVFAAAYSFAPGMALLFLVPLAALHWAHRAYAAARVDRTRLRGLQRATRALAVPVDPRDAIPQFLSEVRSCFASEVVDLVVAHDAGRTVRRVRAGGQPPCEIHEEREDTETLAATLLERRTVTCVDRRCDDAVLADLLRHEGWRDCLAAPVRSPHGVVGVLCSYNRTGLEGFEEGERVVLEALADEVGRALEKATLIEAIFDERRKLAEESTGLKKAEKALRDSEARFRALVQNSSDMVMVADAEGAVTYASPSCRGLLADSGCPDSPLRLFDGVHTDDLARVRAAFARSLAAPGVTTVLEYRTRASDGSWRDVETLATNLLDDRSVGGIVLNTRDITERKRAEALVSGQASILESIAREAPLGETFRTLIGVVEAQSPGARCAILVVDDDEALRTRAAPNVPDAVVQGLDALGALPATSEHWRHPFAVPDVVEDPAWRDLRETLLTHGFRASWRVPVLTLDNGVLGTVVLFHESARSPEPDEWRLLEWSARLVHLAVERIESQANLAHQASHDPLTGLANRVVFLDRLDLALARAERSHAGVAVMFLDLDRFKFINDSLGHDTGDRVLMALVERLQRVVRPTDTVARFGGDEFTILCEGITGEDQVVGVAERVREALAMPVELDVGEVFVTTSIGIALAFDAQRSPQALVENADAAMYKAKERGGNHHEFFDEAMRDRARRRLTTQNDLHRAIEREEFRVFYQPTVSLETGRVVGFEALVRWEHPERGLTSPGDFIAQAEETGLIVPIGNHVLQEACRQAERWRADRETASALTIHVNLSARQFAQPDLVEVVADALSLTATGPGEICLEITESVLMEDADSTAAGLRDLKDLGVTLAIDDFGTGYSSLNYLKRFPVDRLKVDKSFVHGLGRDPEDSAIVAAVVSLAHTLGLVAVAEGVETEEQLARLREMGCDVAQGFYLGGPVPADALSLDLLTA